MIEAKRILDAEEKEFRRLALYRSKYPDWMRTRNLQARRPHLSKDKITKLYSCKCGASDMKREEAYDHKCGQGMMQIPDDRVDPRRKAIKDSDL